MSTIVTSTDHLAELPIGTTFVVSEAGQAATTWVKTDDGHLTCGGTSLAFGAFATTIRNSRIMVESPHKVGDVVYDNVDSADWFRCIFAQHGEYLWARANRTYSKGYSERAIGIPRTSADHEQSTGRTLDLMEKDWQLERLTERLDSILEAGRVPAAKKVTATVEASGTSPVVVPARQVGRLLEGGLTPAADVTVTAPWTSTVKVSYESRFGCQCGTEITDAAVSEAVGSGATVNTWKVLSCTAHKPEEKQEKTSDSSPVAA